MNSIERIGDLAMSRSIPEEEGRGIVNLLTTETPNQIFLLLHLLLLLLFLL